MELQEILSRHLGGFGCYQIYIMVLSIILCTPLSIHTIAYIIYAATPKFWCVYTPRNDVINLTAADWMALFIPRKADGTYDQCSTYTWATDDNINSTFINKTLGAISRGEQFGRHDQQPCEAWEYDTKAAMRSTLVMEWDMVCGRAWMKSTIASMFALGWILGTEVSGYMADRLGRRKTSLVFSTMTVIFGIALPFCSNFVSHVVIRVLIGFFANGAIGLYFTIAMEILVAKDRSWASNIYWTSWALVYLIIALLGYLLRDWFPFMLACFVPTAISLVAGLLLPESVAWLVAKGKQDEAKQTLLKIARFNGKSLPKGLEISVNTDETKTETRMLDLFRTPNMRRITIVMVITMFFNGLVYYSIAWNTPDLHGNLYLNVALLGAMEIVAYILNIPFIRTAGRRFGLAISLSLAGLLYLASISPVGDVGQVVLIMLAKFCITISFVVGFIYLGELYPTVIRVTGLSLSLLAARVGVFVAPYVPLFGPNVAEVLCGVMCVLMSACVLLLPETLSQPLKTTVEEAERSSNLNWRRLFVIPRHSVEFSPLHKKEKVQNNAA